MEKIICEQPLKKKKILPIYFLHLFLFIKRMHKNNLIGKKMLIIILITLY